MQRDEGHKSSVNMSTMSVAVVPFVAGSNPPATMIVEPATAMAPPLCAFGHASRAQRSVAVSRQ